MLLSVFTLPDQDTFEPAPAPPANVQAAAPLSVNGMTPMAAATPVNVSIPSIGADSSLVPLGLNTDRTIEVPPVSKPKQAGFFKYAAMPGTAGPAVILGHIDGGGVQGVFYHLSDTKPGDQITVNRSDHTAAVFTVNAVRSFPKTDFPTDLVYDNTNDSEIRLISCGGALDRQAHNYLSNIVVFGTLSGTHPAP